jgi:hypothetical protein
MGILSRHPHDPLCAKAPLGPRTDITRSYTSAPPKPKATAWAKHTPTYKLPPRPTFGVK